MFVCLQRDVNTENVTEQLNERVLGPERERHGEREREDTEFILRDDSGLLVSWGR